MLKHFLVAALRRSRACAADAGVTSTASTPVGRIAIAGLLASSLFCACGLCSAATIAYKQVLVNGITVSYRESSANGKPNILLLHGVPSSSRMYDRLMRQIGSRYHMVALDYPGFGNSDAPDPRSFAYTFDHLAEVVAAFTDAIRLDHYVLFMQDYGAPIGMRVAMARPRSVSALIFQNGNLYQAGLGAVWAKRRLYWADRTKYDQEIRDSQASFDVVKQRHLGDDPNVQAYDPDLWRDEVAFLNRPGEADIQTALIYDYRTNIDSYPQWQQWLKAHPLPTLVLWGKHDLSFTVPGAWAFRQDLPGAQIEILDGGHFVMDTRLDEVARLTVHFLESNRQQLRRAIASPTASTVQ
jgi:pimeloyl-ACP methyl ester carboxylesterase